MTDQAADFVAREMQRASAGTADCPNLVPRVAAGVARRRQRRRVFAGTFAAAAIAAAMPTLPTLQLLPGAAGSPAGSRTVDAGQPQASCSGLSAMACHTATVRAQRALRLANSSDLLLLRLENRPPICQPRQLCRGPI
jgi:hypothetical protein